MACTPKILRRSRGYTRTYKSLDRQDRQCRRRQLSLGWYWAGADRERALWKKKGWI